METIAWLGIFVAGIFIIIVFWIWWDSRNPTVGKKPIREYRGPLEMVYGLRRYKVTDQEESDKERGLFNFYLEDAFRGGKTEVLRNIPLSDFTIINPNEYGQMMIAKGSYSWTRCANCGEIWSLDEIQKELLMANERIESLEAENAGLKQNMDAKIVEMRDNFKEIAKGPRIMKGPQRY